MPNLKKLPLKLTLFGMTLLLFSCHNDHHIDERYPFLGEYYAVESFYNKNTMTQESFNYYIEIVASKGGNEFEIIVTGYGNGGIYGTNCSFVGSVYNGMHIDIPVNVCHYDYQTDYTICGHGDISEDGEFLTFELDIVRCDSGVCNDEPTVYIEAHRI